MKGLSYFFGMAAFACSSLFAGTVTVTSAGGSQFATSGGALLPPGCAVRIGTFNLPAATRDQTLAAARDYAQLLSWFRPLAEGVVGGGTTQQMNGSGNVLRTNNYPSAGEVFGQISGINEAYIPAGTQLYVWVFDSATPEAAEQWGIFTAGTWAAPPALGAQALSTAAAVQPLQGTTASDQLRLRSIPSSYGNWSWKKFGTAAAAAVTDFNADTDGDGLKNLVEYAWGLNPNSRDASQASLNPNQSGATFTFKNPLHLPDVSVVAECSSDLKTWTLTSSTVVETTADYEVRSCTAPAGTRCFWRVKFVSVTPP